MKRILLLSVVVLALLAGCVGPDLEGEASFQMTDFMCSCEEEYTPKKITMIEGETVIIPGGDHHYPVCSGEVMNVGTAAGMREIAIEGFNINTGELDYSFSGTTYEVGPLESGRYRIKGEERDGKCTKMGVGMDKGETPWHDWKWEVRKLE